MSKVPRWFSYLFFFPHPARRFFFTYSRLVCAGQMSAHGHSRTFSIVIADRRSISHEHIRRALTSSTLPAFLLWTVFLVRSITLINAVEGRIRKTIHSHKYGCGVVRYTHHDQVSSLDQARRRTLNRTCRAGEVFGFHARNCLRRSETIVL